MSSDQDTGELILMGRQSQIVGRAYYCVTASTAKAMWQQVTNKTELVFFTCDHTEIRILPGIVVLTEFKPSTNASSL